MKGNSDISMNSGNNSYLLDEDIQYNKVFEKLFNDFSTLLKPKKNIRNSNFLNNLWRKLVSDPSSLTQNQNPAISNILEKETGSLVSDAVNSVLSEKLELPTNSKKLSVANEESIKIFHEDYPGDFILEYKGERLGLMMLDKCFNSKGEAHLIYRFNPQIQSFRGLF